MLDKIHISYPGYFLIVIFLVALVYALGLYYKDRKLKENHSWLPYLLSFFRFFAVLGILFLLLTPLIRHFTSEKQDPVIVIAVDKSASVNTVIGDSQILELEKELDELGTSLSDKFEIRRIDFAENMVLTQSDSLRNQSSNLSEPLEYISEAYEDQNLGAVILVSDGIYNEGKNPIYSNAAFKAPLHSIAVGDTTIRTDLLIRNALHNRLVYLNDKFSIEADVQAYNSAGSVSELALYEINNGNAVLLESKAVRIGSDNYFQSFTFEAEAKRTGNIRYRLELKAINNEISYSNNSRNIYIEVLDARQKILMVAHAPHPDIKAIRAVVESHRNYEFELAYAGQSNINPANWDLVILHNLPSVTHPLNEIFSRINREKIPFWIICGASCDMASFNNVQQVLTVNGASDNLNNVTTFLNPNFNLFTLSESFKQEIGKFVPLKSKFGNYAAGPVANTLLWQKIGSVETDYPLLAFSDRNNHKQAVLTGEGIWRWRLVEFAEHEDQKTTDELVLKTLQYISAKEDKRPFRAFTNKKIYTENENVIFDAQLYNASFEPINEPETQLTIVNDSGETFEYTFSKTNNYYSLDAGRFSEGDYRYTAQTNYNGKEHSSSGNFSVQTVQKEQYDLTARHDLLHNLSHKFNGEVYYPDQISELGEKLRANDSIKPVLYQKVQTNNLLNFKWLLLLFILLLAAEWAMRRYFGYY